MRIPSKIIGSNITNAELASKYNQLIDALNANQIRDSETLEVQARTSGGTTLRVKGNLGGSGGSDSVWS